MSEELYYMQSDTSSFNSLLVICWAATIIYMLLHDLFYLTFLSLEETKCIPYQKPGCYSLKCRQHDFPCACHKMGCHDIHMLLHDFCDSCFPYSYKPNINLIHQSAAM